MQTREAHSERDCEHLGGFVRLGPSLVDEVVTIHDIVLTVRTGKERRIKKVSLPLSGSRPRVTRKGASVEVTVPRLDIHQAVLFEFQQ